jgi:hypothetical protein
MNDRQTQANEIQANEIAELTDAQRDAVTGGSFQALSSAISDVMKNFGGALQTAARG